MTEEISLPNSQYIDTNLGLKYLNGNKKLYLKVLNSFLTRYQHFDINTLMKDELISEMHALKGLSSTLGMQYLSNLAQSLHRRPTEELLRSFSETLTLIITDLSIKQTKTILIISDNIDDIDSIIEVLEDSYDIMVITNPSDDLKNLGNENINIVLLSLALSNHKIIETLKQNKISIIELSKPIKFNKLQLVIKNT